MPRSLISALVTLLAFGSLAIAACNTSLPDNSSGFRPKAASRSSSQPAAGKADVPGGDEPQGQAGSTLGDPPSNPAQQEI